MESQPVAHAHVLDVQVCLGQRDFALQGRVRLAHPRQCHLEVAHQIVEHALAGGKLDGTQAPDVCQGVEQEMRLDLRLQHLQARLRHLAIKREAVDFGSPHGVYAVHLMAVELDHAGDQRGLLCITHPEFGKQREGHGFRRAVVEEHRLHHVEREANAGGERCGRQSDGRDHHERALPAILRTEFTRDRDGQCHRGRSDEHAHKIGREIGNQPIAHPTAFPGHVHRLASDRQRPDGAQRRTDGKRAPGEPGLQPLPSRRRRNCGRPAGRAVGDRRSHESCRCLLDHPASLPRDAAQRGRRVAPTMPQVTASCTSHDWGDGG